MSLPIYISYKSEEQEEGISCQLIPAHCRSCNLKANMICLNTLTNELCTILCLHMAHFTPFEKITLWLLQQQNLREQLQGTNLTPLNHINGWKANTEPSVCPALCLSSDSSVLEAVSYSRAVGAHNPEGRFCSASGSCLRSLVQSVQISVIFKIRRMSFSTLLEILDPEVYWE